MPDANVAVLVFGLAAIALLVLGERLLPGRPVALVVVIAAIVVLSVTPLAQQGFKTVGILPAGLPALSLPSLRPRDVDGILPLAFACFLLAYIEGVSAARSLAQQHGYTIDPRQELLALGAANAAAAFGQGYPVAGGLSQSTVNDKAGARTPMSLVFASAAIAVCLLFLTDLLRNLPDVVLAAIVLVAVKGLVNVRELRRTWTLSRDGVLGRDDRVRGRAAARHPEGRAAGRAGVDGAAHPPRGRATGVAPRPSPRHAIASPTAAAIPTRRTCPARSIVRVEAGLLYFNAGHVRDEVQRLVAEAGRGRAGRGVGPLDVPLRRHRGLAHAARRRARACRARDRSCASRRRTSPCATSSARRATLRCRLPAGRVTVAEAVGA